MAGEEVYIARMGAWITRALGRGGAMAENLDTEPLGFLLPDGLTDDAGLRAAAAALADAGNRLAEAADEIDAALAGGGQNDQVIPAVIHLLEAVYHFADAIAQLVTRLEAAAAALPAADRTAVLGFTALLARRSFDYLVISTLEQQFPRTELLLRVLGLIERKVIAGANPGEPLYARKTLRLERIKDLISDPAAHFQQAFGWGTAAFDPSDIMQSIPSFYEPETEIENGVIGADPFLRFGPFLWRRDGSVNPPGLMLDYSAKIAQHFDNRADISDAWGTTFAADLAIEGGAIARLKPPFAIAVEPKTGTASGAFSLTTNRNENARGFSIVGGNDFVRLVADDFAIGADLVVGANTTGAVSVNPGVFANLKGLTLSLGAEGSDNFLASLLASADIEGVFDLGLRWSLADGLMVRAAGGLEIALPMHQSLGIATLETLYLILKIQDDGSFLLEVSTMITGNIGPLTAAVERMGVELVLSFADQGDASNPLGPVNLALRFKPPNGLALALDAGAVRGGGYLYFDYDKGEYAGALELSIAELFSAKAIGLLNTKMPDGSDGFSLLIIITAEFGTPIQLGYGFTLIGLGGLLGLNRTMMLEELAEGVRTGAVENIMFPHDVIANAPQIISDMKRFFPIASDRFLIGPMAKLGWGTPTLISASLAVIIEIPPGNVAILGVLKCVLPDEEAALLVLQVKFIGALEVNKQRLWFFASLFGSRVLFITLSGEMGLLIAWGDNANFVLSVGGFHPRFTPPPMPFPVPQRIALSILDEEYARIRVEAYFAVTANTVQFGAHAELFFGLSEFSIEGQLGLDALFQFSPFYFIVEISASVSVKVFGAGLFSVRVRGQLEGTTPWHIEGEGSISILFFDIDVPFSHTWGDSADTMLEAIDALPILKLEFEKRDNWQALPPAGAPVSVSLRQIEATKELVLHPVGTLRISQRAVPLDVAIQKVGNRKVADVTQLTVRATAAGLAERGKVQDQFAPAQYRDIDGAGKLSSPGYEKMDAGIDISVAGTDSRTSHAVKRIVFHELITIDNNYKEHLKRFFFVPLQWFTSLLSSNATARSSLSQQVKQQQVPFDDRIIATEPGFVIASAIDNSPVAGSRSWRSHAEAVDWLADERQRNPKAANDMHVIPAAEARTAA